MIFMNKKDSASISIMKIIGVSLIFILIFGVSVMATEVDIRSVEITMSNGYTMTVITTKTNVEEILADNNIVIEEDERVNPGLEEEITESNKITITNKSEQEVQIAKISESGIETTLEEILKSYSPIIEKIVVEQENIPYETITKDASQGSTDTKNKVIQQGEDGIKEITYKIKYQNDVEIERTQISEQVVQEPVDKIVQVSVQVSNRFTMASRNLGASSASAAEAQAYARQRCTAYGWSENDYYNLVALWNKESHWNMYAQNRYSGAYGIPQALPGSKMASAGSDYLTNYQTQVNWGLSYIKGRYGNPTVALYHSQATGWY